MVKLYYDEFKEGGVAIMKISTLNLFLKDAPKNFRNNAATSIVSTTVIMSTLFILELFLVFFLNLKMGIIGVYSQFEIRVTLKDDIKIAEQQNIYNKIKAVKVVADIAFENNTPLSAAYIIKVNESDDIPKITSRLNGLQGINKIDSGEYVPKRILVIAKIIQWIGAMLFFILVIAAFFLIKNIIKLAIYPRHNEIRIMQYLGATDWFIRWPFIFYGMIVGFLGGVFAVIAIYFLYSFAYRQAASFFPTMFVNFINPSFILTTMSWSFILIGIILSTIGSILVVKKFLNM